MRELIRLVSTAGTGYHYYTTKNKRTKPTQEPSGKTGGTTRQPTRLLSR